ncbi:MAG TPA: hypothetical protein VKB04_11760 [Anaerolineales bacterium]|nr:hypothetical protein [Anaerolineales bacterium]
MRDRHAAAPGRDISELFPSWKGEIKMNYETPEVHEVGEAVAEIKTVFTANPMDLEPSTGWQGFVDPAVADH